jgi:3-hydroxymyristoyl/3-hydroxydecanoyl-(acyl carrier protein) dehydratase
MSDTFTVPSDSPCVQGHFPGMAIVPGAYLLSLLDDAFRSRYPAAGLPQFAKVKFLAPIVPQEPVAIAWDESRWPQVKITLSVSGQIRLQASVGAAA